MGMGCERLVIFLILLFFFENEHVRMNKKMSSSLPSTSSTISTPVLLSDKDLREEIKRNRHFESVQKRLEEEEEARVNKSSSRETTPRAQTPLLTKLRSREATPRPPSSASSTTSYYSTVSRQSDKPTTSKKRAKSKTPAVSSSTTLTFTQPRAETIP
jgi:hypothetical protein